MIALDRATKKVYLVTAEDTTDPAKQISKAVAALYPNRHSRTFTVLTYTQR